MEAETFVEIDGTLVVASNVQKRPQPRDRVETEDITEQVPGIALAGVTGKGTDGTDLAVAWQNDSLAGHGDKGSVDVNAEVVAKDIGPGAEEAREGGVGEGDHGR